MLYLVLLIISVLPAALLMVLIYFQDKYQKEPLKSLIKAFFGGVLAVIFTLITGIIIEYTIGLIPILNQTVFYDSFITAGIPEELCKFLVFMMFIWRDKNFDEYFDGIVYACFISLGFATIENIMYVIPNGIGTGVVRALISVPGHFLFGVILGYFLSLAKFESKNKGRYIMLGLLFAIVAHGLFDWLLMFSDRLGGFISAVIYIGFIVGDVFLWRLGIKLIKKHQDNSLLQAEQTSETNNEGYSQIDWNAGDKQ